MLLSLEQIKLQNKVFKEKTNVMLKYGKVTDSHKYPLEK